MVSLDRPEKGKDQNSALQEVKETYGFPTAAIVSMPEVVLSLKERGLLDASLEEQLKNYYDCYGALDKPLNL